MARTRNTVETVFEGKDRTSDDIRRIQKNLGGLQQTTQRFGQFMRSPLGLIGTAGAAVLALRQVSQGFQQFTNDLSETSKMARQLGVTTEFLSEIDFAAQSANIPVQQMRIGLQRMGRRAAEAARGGGEAVAAFRELGISLRDSQGNVRSVEALMPQVARALSGVRNETDRLRLAFKLFDSEGVKMLRLTEDFEGLMQAARETGATISTEAGKAAEEYTQQLANLGQQFKAVGISISADLLPPVAAWLEELNFMINMAKAGALEGIGDAIGNWAKRAGWAALEMTGFADAVRSVQDITMLRGLRDLQQGPMPGGPPGVLPYPSAPGLGRAAGLTGAETETLENTREFRDLLASIDYEFENIVPKMLEITGPTAADAVRLTNAEWNEWRGTINKTGSEAAQSLSLMLPVLDQIIDKLTEAGNAGDVFGDVIKGAATGFVFGGPAGAFVGGGGAIVGSFFREGDEVERG